ncbi:interleukin-17 receptor D isoform X2 [Amia ocellicauda]|uniref:interleukin-17 receptor D isoform X2 n=1 Tax=Amia ocellicauda TaxID=2972642 RepID=UPI0034641AD4
MSNWVLSFLLGSLICELSSGRAKLDISPVSAQNKGSRCRRTAGDIQYSFQSCDTLSPCRAEGGTTEECEVAIGQPESLQVTSVTDGRCPGSEAVVLAWTPSRYGMAFLRGFHVRLHSEDGSEVKCKRLAINRTRQLDASDADIEFRASFCVSFSTLYFIQVYAYPFLHIKTDEFRRATTTHRSRACGDTHSEVYCTNCMNFEGYAKESCIKKWVPSNITISGVGTSVRISFNTAPNSYSIPSYSVFYARQHTANWSYVTLQHKSARHGYVETTLQDLTPGANYTIQIFSDLLDSTRKQIVYYLKETGISKSDLAGTLMLPPSVPPQSCPRRPPPSIFLCYSSCEGPGHIRLVLALASYLQQHCACQVTLDLWEEEVMAREGHMTWLSEQIGRCRFVMVLCSESLKRLVDLPSSSSSSSSSSSPDDCRGRHLFMAAAALAGEQLLRAQLSSGDLSKFITVSFSQGVEGGEERSHVPRVLELATHYQLMEDFPQLFSHLHFLPLEQPGVRLRVSNINKDDYFCVGSGYALFCALRDRPLQLT